MRVREELAAEVESGELDFVSITLDPAFDRPEVLAEYAALHDVKDGWTFYTGDLTEITELRHRLGAFDPDPEVDADRTQHAAVLILANEAKGRYCAVPGLTTPTAIARAVRRVMTL